MLHRASGAQGGPEPRYGPLLVPGLDMGVRLSAGVPDASIRWQRHTMATLWPAAGVPVKVVQERLGHARPLITMNIYAPAIPGMQRQAVEQLRGLFHTSPEA